MRFMYLEESSAPSFLPVSGSTRSFREVEITLINPETTQERVFTVRPQKLLAGPFLNGAALFSRKTIILDLYAGLNW